MMEVQCSAPPLRSGAGAPARLRLAPGTQPHVQTGHTRWLWSTLGMAVPVYAPCGKPWDAVLSGRIYSTSLL